MQLQLLTHICTNEPVTKLRELTCQNPGAYVMVSSGYLTRTSAVKGFPAAGPRCQVVYEFSSRVVTERGCS